MSATQNPPASTSKLTLKAIFDTIPSYSTLAAATMAELADVAKAATERDSKLAKERKVFNGSAKSLGKLIAALKVKYAAAQDSGQFGKEMTFSKYHESVCGGTVNNHAESCSVAYTLLVLTGKLPEAKYDSAATDWIEKASATLSALLKKHGGDRTLVTEDPAFGKVLAILADPNADTAAASLRAITKEVKGEAKPVTVEDAGKETLVDYSPKLLAAVINRAFAENDHALVVGILTDEISEISKRNRHAGAVRDFYTSSVFKIEAAWKVSGIDEATITSWDSEWIAAKAPLTLTLAPAPTPEPSAPVTPDFAAWVAANQYPSEVKASIGLDEAELTEATTESVTDFFRTQNRLPANIGELDRYMDGVEEYAPAALAAA
ncbi:MAG: hypothetical protein ACYDC1_17430 [Limisphaerales bacterium]